MADEHGNPMVATAEVTNEQRFLDAFEKADPWKTIPCSSAEEASRLNTALTATLKISIISRYDSDAKELDVRIPKKELM